jgi:hypothetical protein
MRFIFWPRERHVTGHDESNFGGAVNSVLSH